MIDERLTEEQLKEATPEELSKILTRIESESHETNNALVEIKTKIEAKTEELEQIKAKVKERFGVDSVDELEVKKAELIKQFLKVQEELQGMVEENTNAGAN